MITALPSRLSIKPINFSSAEAFVKKKKIDKINSKLIFILIRSIVFFLNKYISKILITSLIIISFYNIFSIFILSFSFKNDGYLTKTLNYLPYKYSIFFEKPLGFSKQDIGSNNLDSKKLYYLMSATEKKSALDYTFWEAKILHQINNKTEINDFERNFINLAILSKNNARKKKNT